MAFSNPQTNILKLGLDIGMRVADFGSGSGHYTLAAAKLVGGEGRVYAIDLQQELLKRVKHLAAEEHFSNVEIVWGDLEELGGTKLGDEVVDRVILANTLFQTERRSAVIEEAKRVLKKGGQLLLVEWSDSHGGLGPRPEDVLSKTQAEKLFEGGGFTLTKEFDAGDHHYGVIFKKF